VFGHKPTYGIVPPRGQALPGRLAASDISVIGPMGRSAADLDVGLSVMAGADEIDGAGWTLRLRGSGKKRLRDFRVAVMLTDENSEVDQEVQDRLQALADFLAKKKAKVSDQARPAIDTREAHRTYIYLLRAATSGRQTDRMFRDNVELARGLSPEDDGYYARMLRANVLSHRDWLALNEVRTQMRWRWAEFFEEWDLLLCPPAASAAFPHDHHGERHERTIQVNGRAVPTTDQLFWAGYTGMAYLPSSVAPIGFTPSGLPVGVQIAGPQYGDRVCIEFARLLEDEYQPFVPPPGYA
jgi:amidase